MAISPQQQDYYQFNGDFWTHYAERHPNDGVRPGFRGYNPQYRVPGTEFIIKRYVTGRGRIGSPQVGLGVVTPENMSMFEGGQGRLRPYIPALAKAVGRHPTNMRSSALITRWLDIDNRDNWTSAVDWLHEKFEIYLGILSQPPPSGNR